MRTPNPPFKQSAARRCGQALLSVLPILLLTASCLYSNVHAQSTASIEGQVTDPDGAVVRGVEVTSISRQLGSRRTVVTDDEGRFQLAALAVGDYRVEVRATDFKTQIVESATLEVGKSFTLNFQLQVGDVSQAVTVTADRELTEQTTMAVGRVVDQRAVQETPLNGRYFLDLGLLVPGSVTPPQGAFSASPGRGLGSLAINTAGNREETVNYLVNGITLNNLTFSSISFQPADQHDTGVQSRQLDLQRRVRRKLRRRRQHRHALRHERVPRRAVRVPPQRRARRPQLLRLQLGTPRALQA